MFLAAIWVVQISSGQISARLMRYADVSDSHIAFVYGGDIWVMPKDGGTAQQLTHSLGEESWPRFSPDGKELAFSASYNGNVDLFVMPAEAELQSIVTMEAIASGLPVVVVNKGAVPELASSSNGLLFEPRNSEQLATNIVKILSNKKLKKTMSEKSLELIKKHTMNTIGSQYEKVYENILKI